MGNENKQKQREMQLKIYRQMPMEEKTAYIIERKNSSMAKYKKQKEEKEQKKELLREGYAYIKADQKRSSQDIRLFMGNFYNYRTTAAVMLCSGDEGIPVYKVVYSFCSPRDSFSWKMALSYLGRRMKDKTSSHPYTFFIRMSKPGGISDKRMALLVRSHILMDIATQRTNIPARMYQYAVRCSTITAHLELVAPESLPRRIHAEKVLHSQHQNHSC